MSFWSRLGDAFENASDKARAGIAWYTAFKRDYESKDHGWFSDFNRGVDRNFVGPMADATMSGVGKVSQAIDTAYSYGVARPLSTAVQAGYQSGAENLGGALFNMATGRTDVGQAWDRSADISPGQAFTIANASDEELQAKGINPADPFNPNEAEDRYKWLQDSWGGKLRSGSLDFALNLFADPTAAAAHGVKAASTSARTLKSAEETSAALRAAAGATDVSGREARLGKKIDEAIKRTDGLSAAEIAVQPEFRATGDAGALAYAFSRANDVHASDEAGRHAMKRAVWGTMLGDKESIGTLKTMHAGLAEELDRMAKAPAQSAFAAERDAADYGAAALAKVNDAAEPVDDTRRLLIEEELDRLDRILSNAGTSSLVRGSSRDFGKTENAVIGINQSYIREGFGGRPLRVVSGLMQSRLPGHVSVKDPVVGFEQLRQTLSQATLMDKEVRKDLLNRFIAAPTAGDRRGVVLEAEARVVESVGARYGLDAKATRKLLEAADGTRNAHLNVLKTRLYSAAPDDKFVTLADAESDELYAIARPLLQSQIEDHVGLIDPRRLETSIRTLTGNRTWEKGLKTAHLDGLVDSIDGVNRVSDDVLRGVTRAWKDMALFRFAYPVRIQVDSQLRLATHLGAMQYMGMIPGIAKSMFKHTLSAKGTDDLRIRNWFKEGDYEGTLTEMLRKAGVPEEDIGSTVRKVIDSDGTVTDMADALADAGIKRARMEGNFGYVDPADKAWAVAWQRAVNRQIRNSPVAMKAAEGLPLSDLRKFALSSADGRKEWREMASAYGGDVDAWVSDVKAHVDHYLPKLEMREVVVGKSGSKMSQEEKDFLATGEDLFHGTNATFDKFDESAAKMRSGGGQRVRRDGKRTLYFTKDEGVARHFSFDAGEGRLVFPDPYDNEFKYNDTVDKMKDWLGLPSDTPDPDVLRAAIKRHLEDGEQTWFNDPFRKKGDDWQRLTPEKFDELRSELGDDVVTVDMRAFPVGYSPRIIKTKVYGKTLDLTKKENLPPDLVDALRAEGKWAQAYEPGTDWGGWEHEGSAALVDWARKNGYGKIHVLDSAESGGESYIVVPEYIGHNNDAFASVFGPRPVEHSIGRDVSNDDVVSWFGGVDGQANRMRVHGEAFSPTTKSAASEAYEKVRRGWYQWASTAPENVMARSPLYAAAYKRELRDTLARLGDDVTEQELTNARRAADRAARREIGQVLYDSSHTSNMAYSMRYLSPFFGAWEDMMKKWSGLIYEKPWTAVRLDQVWGAPNAAGIVVDSNGNRVDENGQAWLKNPDGSWRKLDRSKDQALIGDGEYMLIPSGILGRVTGQSDFRINKNSLNIVFQGEPWWLPGAGPLVQVGVNDLVRSSFPESADNPLIKYVLPFGTTDDSAASQMLPSWVRQIRNSGVLGGSTQDYANTYALLLAQETSLYQSGQRDEIKPGEIASKTRNWFLLRALSANASPVSMQPSAKLQFYVEQAHIYRQQYGEKWQEQYLQDFPEYYDMSLSLSANPTGIVATENAYDALKDTKIRQAVSEHPDLGWLFVGPDNTYGTAAGNQFSQGVYTWQQTQSLGYGNQMKFRGQRSPQDALAEVESSKGWLQYQKARTLINLKLEQRGLRTLSQKGASDLNEAWQKFLVNLKTENEYWRRDFEQRDEGKVINLLTVATKEMSRNKALASRPDMQALAQYMKGRRFLQEQLASRERRSLDANPDLQYAWSGFVQNLIKDNVGFELMYNRVLERDDLKGEVLV